MIYSILRTREDLRKLAPEWPALLESSSVNSVFLTFDWINSWLDSQDQNRPNLLTITVRDDAGKLVGIAPFYKAEYRLFGALSARSLQILGDTDSGAEYGNIIVDSQTSRIVIQQIRSALQKLKNEWDFIYVRNVASWRKGADELIQYLATDSYSFRSREREFAAFDLPKSYDDYLSSISGNMRYQIKRQIKKLSEDHEIRIEMTQTPDTLDDAMSTLFSLHEARWRVRKEAGSFNRSPELKKFYEVFLPKALKNGWLKMFFIRSSGSPIAVQYGLSYEGTFSQVQEGFDPDKHSGAGNVLRNNVIQHLIEEGHSVYDFLGGFTEHKLRWGAKVRLGSDYIVTNNSFNGYLLRHLPIWPTGRYMTRF